jgi:hypothetical protein|tara:strand:- start:1170 stop:2861 length:1692 start_codon:yes stop_codon:yes gene_type:complete
MDTWFNTQPSLLQGELDRLVDMDASFEIDENEKAKGYLVVHVHYLIEDEVLNLVCRYPDSYPYFPFEIKCENFPEGRHLEPAGKSLCLFADKHNSWDISNDTLAGIIENQVKKIYYIHKSPDTLSEHENGIEGYQPSGQLQTESNSVIITVNEKPPISNNGRGEIKLNNIKKYNEAITGCFNIAYENNNDISFTSESNYHQRLPKKSQIRWVKLNAAIQSTNGKQLLAQVINEYPAMKTPIYTKMGGIKIDIIAVCFQEETTRNKIDYNWVFIVRRAWKDKGKKESIILVKSDHIHPKYLLARTPNLIGLSEKKVVIIGLGALGSHVAWQLARAGVKNFTFVDKDYLQAGNLQRWLMGLPYIGMAKSEAVAHILNNNYLDIQVNPINLEIGSAFPIQRNASGNMISVQDVLIYEILSDVDILIDCTAMLNVNQYLAHLCKKQKIDYVWSSATNGAWGGIVGQSPASYPNDVWLDFNMDYGRGTIPPIATEVEDFVQPKGCFHPTFTGAGFDLDTISIMTTRMAISLLQDVKYGTFNCDVAILEQWENNIPIAPKWKELVYRNG